MNYLTIKAEAFKHDFTLSLLKALQGNPLKRDGIWDRFIGFEQRDNHNPFALSGGKRMKEITFKASELEIDFPCLLECPEILLNRFGKHPTEFSMFNRAQADHFNLKLDLDYLSKLEGFEITEGEA